MRRHVWLAECLEGKGNPYASPTSGKVLRTVEEYDLTADLWKFRADI